MPAWKAWLVAVVVCLIIEIIPPPTHFFFLCVALGALAAAITAFYSSAVWVPWTVFFVATAALVPMLIPLARFLFTPRAHPSNVDALVGQNALVQEPIQPKSPGMVKIHGESWRAFSETETFEKDQWVRIDRVEGTHVVVSKN